MRTDVASVYGYTVVSSEGSSGPALHSGVYSPMSRSRLATAGRRGSTTTSTRAGGRGP